MNSINQFKDDVWTAIFEHAKKIMSPTLIIGVVYFMIMIGLVVAIFASFVDMDQLKEFISMSNQGSFDPESIAAQSKYMEEMIQAIGPSTFVIGILSVYAVMLLLNSWFTNVMLIISEDQLLTGSTSVGDSIKASFNKDFFKLVIFFVLMIILGFFLLVLSGTLVKINLGLFFLSLFLIWFILFRFSAAPGAIVHGKMTVSDAIVFSVSKITFARAGKIMLMLFVAWIVLILAVLMISGITYFMGAIGTVLSFLIQIVLFIVIYALMFSSMSAMFFRYAEVEIQEDESDHLVQEVD